MSAPTLWEEGHASGRRVVRLAMTVGVLVTALDLGLSPGLGYLFGIGFALISVTAALAIRQRDFFVAGVLPPLLMLGLLLPLAMFHRSWLSAPTDSRLQALISGLTHHATALVVGYGLCLVILIIRNQVLQKKIDHSNRDGSPAPTLTTSGVSDE